MPNVLMLERAARPTGTVVRWLALTLGIALSNMAAAAKPDYSSPKTVGDITGIVTDCSGPVAGALVYLPGTSWAARTAGDGGFRITYVQPGIYSLQVLDAAGSPLGEMAGVEVLDAQSTDVSAGLHFCFPQDADGDGFFTPEDCDDLRPNIYPGAVEECDGVDNDCNGVSDDGDVCGLSCSDGVLNGAETDVDCGGPGCAACPVGNACVDGADCESGVCSDGLCAVPSGG